MEEEERRATEAARRRAFGTNSSAMTTCDYVVGPAPLPQHWEFVGTAAGATMIRSKDGASCLSSAGPGIVPCGQCKTDCEWDTASGYSGENGNRGRANETTAQIKSTADGRCLKFSAASRGGKGLYMEACNTDPANCVIHRCFYSANLGDEEWYLANNGQLIASFVRGNGHQIPPLSFAAKQERSVAAAMFNGPVAGLGNDGHGDSLDRCGSMRGANDMGATPMCKGTTSDGMCMATFDTILGLFLTLAPNSTAPCSHRGRGAHAYRRKLVTGARIQWCAQNIHLLLLLLRLLFSPPFFPREARDRPR